MLIRWDERCLFGLDHQRGDLFILEQMLHNRSHADAVVIVAHRFLCTPVGEIEIKQRGNDVRHFRARNLPQIPLAIIDECVALR